MNKDELDALPVISVGQELRIIDGKKVLVPVLPAFIGAQWFEEDEAPGYVDDAGRRWHLVKKPDGSWGKISFD